MKFRYQSFSKEKLRFSVRTQSRRQRSESVESPQRPCTAASNLSKSRPTSAVEVMDHSQKEEEIVGQISFFSFFFYIGKFFYRKLYHRK
jgi:hypothetical protein